MTLAIKAINTFLQSDNGAGFETIAEITSITGPSLARTTHDSTSMDSQECWQEFIGGNIDGGEVQVTANYVPANTEQQQVIADLENVQKAFRLCLPDYGTGSVDVLSLVTATDVVTTTSAHGLTDFYPFKFATTGTFPTATPAITAGKIFYAGVATGSVLTPQVTGINGGTVLDFSTDSWSGTLSIETGSLFTFNGLVSNFESQAPVDGILTCSFTLKISGVVTAPA